jgi:hypothetical protein
MIKAKEEIHNQVKTLEHEKILGELTSIEKELKT